MNEAFFKQQFAGFRSQGNESKMLADMRIVKATMGFLNAFQRDSQADEKPAEKKYTRAEVAQHWDEDSCWIIIRYIK